MPVATPEQYAEMIDTAKKNAFAFPAINVSSSQTLHAALQGFAESGSDGILQVSSGGADYFGGHTVKNRVGGSLAFVAFAEEVAKAYPVTVALHTDHCPKENLENWLYPLISAWEERVKSGGLPLFQSHMWDGSAVPLDEEPAHRRRAAPARLYAITRFSRLRSASSAAKRTASRTRSTTSSTRPSRTPLRWSRPWVLASAAGT